MLNATEDGEMAVTWMEQVVKWSSVSVNRGVPLLSLAMHLVLTAFSGSRRREDRGWRRVLVWTAYGLTAWAPAYILGNLYLETSPSEKIISAFWVPFLLLHSARPDNMSSYTLENDDNTTWTRQMVGVTCESMGSMYILYRYILADTSAGLLRHASCVMIFMGIFKKMESAVALKRCKLGIIRRSLNTQRTSSSFSVGSYGGDENLAELDDEKALLVAHDLFDICKGAFSDYSVEYMDRDTVRSMFSHGWQNMCKVVEMELSLMYDILYTKTFVVYTWGGYAIRLASPPLTTVALLLFWFHGKEGLKIEDIIVTYILFWTTLLLDMRCLLGALVSSWTQSFFKVRQHRWFSRGVVLCRGKWQKLESLFSLWLWTSQGVREGKNYRRWLSGTLGQHNLLDQCTGGRRNALCSRMSRKKLEVEYQYQSRVDIEMPDCVKKLVFKNVMLRCFTAPAGSPDPEQSLSNGMNIGASPLAPPVPRMLSAPIEDTPPPVGGVDRPLHNVPGPSKQPAEQWRHGHTRIMFDQATPDTGKQTEPEEDMKFPPEFEEAILIWHIVTDIFLRCNPATVPAASQEHAKAIKAMSDYMVFLVVVRPTMLPGLKRISLYEKTRLALDEIWKVASVDYEPSCSTAKEKDQLAMWMLKYKDHLKDPGSAIWEDTQMINKEHLDSPGFATVWEGTQLASLLLSLMPGGEHYWSKTTEEIVRTVKKLACWIPDLENHPAGGNTEGMLEFILDAWVRLLIYASIRCSRESHAKQLSLGGELTTMVWVITEHAKISVVKSNCPSFFL